MPDAKPDPLVKKLEEALRYWVERSAKAEVERDQYRAMLSKNTSWEKDRVRVH